MSGHLFGTDGVRGRFGEEPITPETMLKLGWAAGCELAEAGRGEKVIIGKDTRVSGYLLESALEAGFSAAGVDVSLLGPMPTPGIAYLTRTARARAGVVISASHNPFEDNGIKFFSGEGYKLRDDLIERIEARMAEPLRAVSPKQLGKAERFDDAPGRYIEFCKGTLPSRLSLAGLRIVVDSANGAAYDIAPKVFDELGAEVIAIGNHPDGFNINRHCGSTHPRALQEKVVEAEADLGIALDGDADRVVMVDDRGELVDGDRMLYAMARWRKGCGKLNGGVAGTLMTNLALELLFEEEGIPFLRTAVGDRYVLEALMREGWLLGGETSGHIICLDKNTTGDGIIAALEVLRAMSESGRSLADLTQGFTLFPQRMINVPVGRAAGAKLVEAPEVAGAVAEVEAELGREGRVVLRPSGTEPLVRVMIEGSDAGLVDQLARQLAGVVEQVARS